MLEELAPSFLKENKSETVHSILLGIKTFRTPPPVLWVYKESIQLSRMA